METDRGIYLALAELRRRHRAGPQGDRRAPLTEFELRCFSRNGEDGVIAEILARIGPGSRFFVELGIEDEREGNCVFLADVLGWGGLFVATDHARFKDPIGKDALGERVTTLNAAVTPENIEDLFADAGVPLEPDVLSIDIDGSDYWIWEGLDAYRPRLVVIGYNALLPQGRQLAQPLGDREPRGGTGYLGASLDALCALGERKAYRLVHTDLARVNCFFVRSDLVSDKFAAADQMPRDDRPAYFVSDYRRPVDVRHRKYVDLVSGDEYPPGEIEPNAGFRGDGPTTTLRSLTGEEAEALAARTDFVWHQRFALAPGVFTPGVNDIGFLLDAARLPKRLDHATVLDIGTTNGGAAFECERRGARHVVAVDIADDKWFGFAAIKDTLGSRVEHVQANIYELPELLRDEFDFVLLWGVLYHLRHPLLALDNVRQLARRHVSIESAVADHELPEGCRDRSVARFYRRDELAGDSSNWFAPTIAALTDWCRSCGLDPTHVDSWPSTAPQRAMVVASPVEPEYLELSYERPLTCSVAGHGAHFGTVR